jgi:hypothetical protein
VAEVKANPTGASVRTARNLDCGQERALLDDQEKAALEQMIAADAQVKLVAQLAQRFVTMVKPKEAEK